MGSAGLCLSPCRGKSAEIPAIEAFCTVEGALLPRRSELQCSHSVNTQMLGSHKSGDTRTGSLWWGTFLPTELLCIYIQRGLPAGFVPTGITERPQSGTTADGNPCNRVSCLQPGHTLSGNTITHCRLMSRGPWRVSVLACAHVWSQAGHSHSRGVSCIK